VSRATQALIAASAVVLASGCGGTSHGRKVGTAVLLPDLVMRPPSELEPHVLFYGGRFHYRLAFASDVVNDGPGPLVVVGGRRSRATPLMAARQLVPHEAISRRVGMLRYIRGDHDHWHLTNFERFTLRLGRGRVRDDHKIGACLADGHRATEVQHAPRPAPALCGGKKPWLLRVRESMSSGWGDQYAPVLEGQWIDVTGLRQGRYWLVHEVNPKRRLRESRYGNDVAAVLFSLRWRMPGLTPAVRIVRRCSGAARC
jgi:hypothetical protein